MGHEAILLDSAFSVLDEIAVIERRQVTVATARAAGVVAFQHDAGAARRGGCPRLAAEIEALLMPLATDGMLTEVDRDLCALLARRSAACPGLTVSDHDHAWEARRLLRAARVGTLASVADGQPFASLVTPACAPDLSLLLLLSDLSEHTRHLRAEPRCSVLVAGTPVRRQPADRAARQRHRVWRNGSSIAALKARYLAVHPYAAMYADFGDFSLWRIRPLGGLYVGGFGRAARLRAADLAPDPRRGRRDRGGRDRHHRPLQCRSSGCTGGHRRVGQAIGGWSPSMSMAAIWRRASR